MLELIKKLPPIGSLRVGAEFSISWLRANYWRPQRLTIGELQECSRSRTVTPTEMDVDVVCVTEEREEQVGVAPRGRGGHIWRLTCGLCRSRDQLINLLVHSNYM